MKIETINLLCCPFDKFDLQLTIVSKDTEQNIIEGYFVCNNCKRIYPIVKGIPIMSPDEYREFKLEQPLLNRWTKSDVSDNFRLLHLNSDQTT
jgi:uncharacterized protein YbaR (Trm112 family)